MNNAPINPAFGQDLNAQPPVQIFNPGVKPSGAPVSFNQTAQSTMTNMFGTPVSGSYDRLVSNPQTVQVGPQVPTTDVYNQNQQNY